MYLLFNTKSKYLINYEKCFSSKIAEDLNFKLITRFTFKGTILQNINYPEQQIKIMERTVIYTYSPIYELYSIILFQTKH